MLKPSMKTTVTGIGTSQRTDQDINLLILNHMDKVPGLTRGFVTKLANSRKRRILERLRQEPGKPRYPLRWASAKQRRYVMWLLRSTNNLPYERTHQLSQGWEVSVTFNQKNNGGTVTLSNPADAAQYVYGPAQQPYHSDTGWPLMRDVAADEANAFEEDLASGYVTLADPYAGVPQGGL